MKNFILTFLVLSFCTTRLLAQGTVSRMDTVAGSSGAGYATGIALGGTIAVCANTDYILNLTTSYDGSVTAASSNISGVTYYNGGATTTQTGASITISSSEYPVDYTLSGDIQSGYT
jgi:hypothetical protein